MYVVGVPMWFSDGKLMFNSENGFSQKILVKLKYPKRNVFFLFSILLIHRRCGKRIENTIMFDVVIEKWF